MFKKTLSIFMLILVCLIFTSNLFAENQPENIYDSAYVQIEFVNLKLLSDGKIIVFLNYICKKAEELKTSKEYNIELNYDKDKKVNTFLIDNLGNQYPLINAKAFEPRLPVTTGTKAKGVMVFSNGQKTESIDYSKLQFTLVSEQTVSDPYISGTNKIHVALKLY
ncbi:hypothetical protein [Desulfobacula sp.]|uniref:hypothetical protein n=1 Tax=Desulfobacula sp. TaxID=2593537 RepID=UPI001EB7AE21|nr:hypothetical protein [Desulfobacula sp.]